MEPHFSTGSQQREQHDVNGTFGGAGRDVDTRCTRSRPLPAPPTRVFNLRALEPSAVLSTSRAWPGQTRFRAFRLSILVPTLGAQVDEAVKGDFTASGPEGAWTGLTALNITSGGNVTGADLVTVGATTAVQITDTLFSTPTQALTVNGSLTTTINENNDGFFNPGIAVNGGSGTTTVSITQTETALGMTVPSRSLTRMEPAPRRPARSQLSYWMGSAIPQPRRL